MNADEAHAPRGGDVMEMNTYPISKQDFPKSQVLLSTAAVLGISISSFIVWRILSKQLLQTEFMPHFYCYLGKPELIWTHVTADFLIAVSYLSISSTLVYLVYRGKEHIVFHWLLLAFGLFIVACGATHLLEVITVWKPVYLLSAAIIVFTAIASLMTAVSLPFVVPRVLTVIGKAAGAENAIAQMEAAARRSEGLMLELRDRQLVAETLFNSAPDAMLVTDGAGIITAANQQCESLFGYTREELVGESVQILIPQELRQKHRVHREKYFAAPKLRPMGRGLDLQARRKDGSLCPVDITLSPITSKNGTRVLAAVRDITEQRNTQEAIKRQNSQLETANKELDAFSYSVAHDLRAPLRAIDGFSQALAEDFRSQLPPEGQSHLNRVRSAVARMSELIDDLLKLSHIARWQMQKTGVDLSSLATEVSVRLQSLESNGRKVVFAITPELSTFGDKELLRIVLENLMGNAWKFTSKTADARIEVGMQNGGGEQIFFVRDNGPGFDMQYAGKLFGVFQRLHRESEFPGTGIGLATVQRIIHRHGGRIWAEAALSQGATFYFVL